MTGVQTCALPICQTLLKTLEEEERTIIFYESPHRILKTLESLAEIGSGIRVTVAREITKIHEQVVAGDAIYVRDYFIKNPDKVRGEFVVVISAA